MVQNHSVSVYIAEKQTVFDFVQTFSTVPKIQSCQITIIIYSAEQKIYLKLTICGGTGGFGGWTLFKLLNRCPPFIISI